MYCLLSDFLLVCVIGKDFTTEKPPFFNAALRAVPCLEISLVFFGRISTRAYSHTVVSLMHCLLFQSPAFRQFLKMRNHQSFRIMPECFVVGNMGFALQKIRQTYVLPK